MAEQMKWTCQEGITRGEWSSMRTSQCGRPAKFERDGKHYCGIHNPARQDARDAAWNEERRAYAAKSRMESAAPDLYEAVTGLLNRHFCTHCKVCDQAKAALAKAKGE